MAKQQQTGTAEQRSPAVLFGVGTHIGGRPNLEDRARAAVVRTAGGLTLTVAMVADGIGGNVQGERAAELTVAVVFQEIERSPVANPLQLPLVLTEALQRANTSVFEEGRQDRSRRGMGTTAVLAALHDNQLYLANVGDSRAYLIRDGQAIQITRDHTWAHEMQRQRLLTEAEIVRHPKRHELVRSIGYGSTVDVDLGIYTNGLLQDEAAAGQNQGMLLQADDRLVLCSDGLIKERADGAGPFVTDAEMVKIVTQRPPAAAAEALVQRAVGRHADDNVTAAVLELPGSRRALFIPPALLYGVLGLAALLVVGLLAFLFLRGGGDQPTPTATGQTPAATAGTDEAPTLASTLQATAGEALVIDAGGATWEMGQTSGGLVTGSNVALPEGQRVIITNAAGVAQLVTPDGARLYLGPGAEITLLAESATTTGITLGGGRLLVQSDGGPVMVGNDLGARAELPGAGVLGIYLDPSSLLFEAACLQGGCQIAGAADPAPTLLNAGQGAVVGGDGRASVPEPADYEGYRMLAPDLVPEPTVTPAPTQTSTATPTNTPSPLPTRPRMTPTLPATVAPSPTPAPAATATEDGGGEEPEPTRPAATEPPPTEPPPTDEAPSTPTSEA
jgi:protein phosphatase